MEPSQPNFFWKLVPLNHPFARPWALVTQMTFLSKDIHRHLNHFKWEEGWWGRDVVFARASNGALSFWPFMQIGER